MPKLSQQKIDERKFVIEDAARELLIKQGFHATSMRDIARRAKISLGNVYNYYETKEAIFDEVRFEQKALVDDYVKFIESYEGDGLIITGSLYFISEVKAKVDFS